MFGNKNKKGEQLESFVIYDSKSQSYNNPSFAPNKDVLLREILQMFKDPAQSKNQLLTNAEDFSIFRNGVYNRSTGQIDSSNLEHVANLHDLRALVSPEPSVDQMRPV